MKISGFTREQTLAFEEPQIVMQKFNKWIAKNSMGGSLSYSDNNGFDWMFMQWYFIHFVGKSPFGYSSTNIGSLYKGIVKNVYKT